MSLLFADPTPDSIPLRPVSVAQFEALQGDLTETARAWCENHGFRGTFGQFIAVPGPDGRIDRAYVGLGTPAEQSRNRFALGAVRPRLPAGTYHLEGSLDTAAVEPELLGWLLSGYGFGRYKEHAPIKAQLVRPDDTEIALRLEAIAAGEALTRDLINTPAEHMGPPDLEQATRNLADAFSASFVVVEGDHLLTQNFPMIHTVGRAADRAPRLLDLRWGDSGPTLTLVGKGVCFDTGGLNLKPGASMGLMKKDMGGSATVLGLAHMIMALKFPLQLRVLIPAVENSVSGNAFRPQDILTSRKGLTVEINNTDAEGRLVLADALAFADEEKPDLIISMATLTGAARVAVGPDLAPFYTDKSAHAHALENAATRVADPVWRLPFHAPYETMIEPGIADLDNAPKGGFAGSITAALFLRRFVTDSAYMHFDIYGWQPTAAPARPKGGVGQGARAVLDALPDLLNL